MDVKISFLDNKRVGCSLDLASKICVVGRIMKEKAETVLNWEYRSILQGSSRT